MDRDCLCLGSLIGNSSSGIHEAPSLLIPAINIGNRQLGRLRAKSVIDSQPDVTSIQNAIERLFSREFQSTLPRYQTPMGKVMLRVKLSVFWKRAA